MLDPAALHPRLAADSHLLGALPSALLLLHREAALHWFILVPATACDDLTDLPPRQREGLLDDAAALGAFLKEECGYPKVNVGALGNVVPQLHLHVIGRRPGDCCWPDPVWGRPLPGHDWSDEALQGLVGRLGSLGLRELP
ncbi:HIT family protein [Pseudohaliea rubra]|uniref:Diadenosine tetraphosphate (Ap4A) hydrolase and other HIT family hydrolase n=1 Tax=Pseudohaliea rubra DSM 19751 TaxID=1265313 RepID=A0A095VTG8_9GAMM|nr:HIT family protein [Pseudohaliea rubra]KGE04650.1 Diadenosine tetraphosphate (Ap4A) hydrolase and other HIT family hydrolase [Pseudohaliea rubra DSM 19751]